MANKADSISDSRVAAGSSAASMASYVFAGKIFTYLMTGIALILVTRLLGPSQYGIYTLAIAFGGIFGSLGYFSVGLALNKFVAEYKQLGKKSEMNEVVSTALFIIIVSGLIIGGFCILFGGLISQYVFHTGTMSLIIKLVALEIVAVMFFGVFYDTLVGFGRGKHMAIVVGIQALLQASVSIFLAFEGFGAAAPIIGLMVSYFVGFIVGVYLVFRYNNITITRPSGVFVKKILYFSAPLALASIFSNFSSGFALIFLGYYVSTAIIGNVGITAKTSSLIGVIFDSISLALLPAFSAALVNKKLNKNVGKMYGYVVYLAILLVGPILFYMALFSTPFVHLLFGSQYAYSPLGYTYAAPLYISIMSIGLLIGVAGSYANSLLISANEVMIVFRYTVIIDLVMLLLVLVFVPFLSSLAYAIAVFLVTPIITSTIFLRKLSVMFKLDLRVKKVLRLIVANIIVSGIALPLYFVFNGIILLILAAALFLVLYPLVSALAGGVDKTDMSTIKDLSREIPLVGMVMGIMVDYAALVIR